MALIRFPGGSRGAEDCSSVMCTVAEGVQYSVRGEESGAGACEGALAGSEWHSLSDSSETRRHGDTGPPHHPQMEIKMIGPVIGPMSKHSR